MIEDYRIRLRVGRSVPTGTYEINRYGNTKEKMRFQEIYQTEAAGELLPEEWMKRVKAEIAAAGEEALLGCIEEYCKRNLMWLRKEKDLEEYALDIHVGRIYRLWEDFKSEEIEYLFFIG